MHKSPVIVDESVNNPHNPTKERFLWLEAQVVDRNCNVNILMFP